MELGTKPDTPCWEWPGANGRYGRTTIAGRRLYVHRVSFEMFVRTLEPGELVLHRCDNPPCWNPWHLFAGGKSENLKDAILKGVMRHHRPDRCKRGHDLGPVPEGGGRRKKCQPCNNIAASRYRQKVRSR